MVQLSNAAGLELCQRGLQQASGIITLSSSSLWKGSGAMMAMHAPREFVRKLACVVQEVADNHQPSDLHRGRRLRDLQGV